MAEYPLIMRIVANSICTADRAGQIIRNIMERGKIGVVEKGVNDPQTEADRMSESVIVSSLSKQFPGLKIIGEEGVETSLELSKDEIVEDFDQNFLENQKCPESLLDIKEDDLVVYVDPLDGTNSYVKGFLEEVTVLIGIAHRESSIAGIIHQPYYKASNGHLGRTIWSIHDVFGNQSIYGGQNFTVKKPPENRFICVTSRTHESPLNQDVMKVLMPDETICVGGAGFKILQLLEGHAHCFIKPSSGCKKWDTCAPEALLESCGGTLTDIMGKHYGYGKNSEYKNNSGVCATFGVKSHDEIIEKIPENVMLALNWKN